MKKDDVLNILTAMKKSYMALGIPDPEAVEALEMAINAVKAEPCEDSISRQAVLDLAKKGVLVSNDSYKSVCRVINDLPSVNPVKTGHWTYYQNEKGDWINECSVCGSDAGVGYQYPYCPHCGAKMEDSE